MFYLVAVITGALLALTSVAGAQQSTADKVEKKTESTIDKVEQKAEKAADKAKTGTKDAWLVSKTKVGLFADERISGTAINVDAKNGVVTLRGKVATPEEKKAAEEVAKGIEGVTSVTNNLQVVPAPEKKAVDRKDDEIKKAVKDRLAKDSRMKGSDIEVRADNGIVTLVGDAKDLGARARASELARSVTGVKAVKNELKEKS